MIDIKISHQEPTENMHSMEDFGISMIDMKAEPNKIQKNNAA